MEIDGSGKLEPRRLQATIRPQPPGPSRSKMILRHPTGARGSGHTLALDLARPRQNLNHTHHQLVTRLAVTSTNNSGGGGQHGSRKSSRGSAVASIHSTSRPASAAAANFNQTWSLRRFWRQCTRRLKGNKVQEVEGNQCQQQQPPREGSGSNQGSLASESSYMRVKSGLGEICSGSLTLKQGRKLQMLQMIILPFIPIMALIMQNVSGLMAVLDTQNEISNIDKQVDATLAMGKFVTQIQNERAEMSFYVFTDTYYSGSNKTVRFAKTVEALRNISYWPVVNDSTDKKIFASKEIFEMNLIEFRKQIDPNDSNVGEILEYYNQVNEVILEYLTKEIKETNTSHLWRYLVTYKNLLRCIENIGISTVYGINYFGRGFLSTSNYIKYIRKNTLGNEYLNSSLEFSYLARKYYEEDVVKRLHSYSLIYKMRVHILLNARRAPDLEKAINYFELMTDYMEGLRKLQVRVRQAIRNSVEERLDEASKSTATTVCLFVIVLLVSPTIIFLVHKATSTIQLFALNFMLKAEELKKEKKKSDRLLFQMLPPSVAQELRQKRQVQAKYYEQVTIYFSDIVGFTEIAADCNPLEVVIFLNSIYKKFDSTIDRYDVYKIETIGDSYMVASGLPLPNGTLHVSEISTMALDLLAGAVVCKVPHRPGEKLQIRIGIHTGPVVAGVVGTKMPRYCLFGDTVNTASRMESTGEPLKIHLSLEMKMALDVFGGFKIEPRGLIDVKGKGQMETFWLCGKDGGFHRSVELDTPGFFEATNQPAFMADVDEVEVIE